MKPVPLAVAAVLLAGLLAGCATPPARDPASSPLAAGTGGVIGNVVRSGDQERIEGVDVIVVPSGGVAVSDELGHFVVPDLAPGRYTAHVSKSGYVASPVDFTVQAGEYTEIVVFLERTSN